MKVSPFESEYSANDLPSVTGAPMTNQQLESLISQRGPWVRAERAQQHAVLDAVHGYYLAKRFSEEVTDFNGWTNRVVKGAVAEVEARLWKLAVIEVAGVNDRTSLTRGASLQSVLVSMRDALQSSSDPTAASELAQVNALLSATNAERVTSLRYIRHVRNKWAGHPSMDRDFDAWADADKHLSLPLIEDALALLVRSHHEAATLASTSSTLAPLFETPRPDAQTIEDGNGTIIRTAPVTVAWGNVTVLAMTMRDSAARRASALLDQMVSPPGYGDASDTDWRSGSDHARAREAIDESLARRPDGN